MQYAYPIFLDSPLFIHEIDEVDELDTLFSYLQLIEPPPSVIADILASLPPSSQPQPERWYQLDRLVVRDEKQGLC